MHALLLVHRAPHLQHPTALAASNTRQPSKAGMQLSMQRSKQQEMEVLTVLLLQG
jgi:hypothetical protein